MQRQIIKKQPLSKPCPGKTKGCFLLYFFGIFARGRRIVHPRLEQIEVEGRKAGFQQHIRPVAPRYLQRATPPPPFDLIVVPPSRTFGTDSPIKIWGRV